MFNYTTNNKCVDIKISQIQNNSFKIKKALYLIIYILLENSVKFALPNTEIRINFIEDENNTTIVISNITEKITINDNNSLFERGVRGNNAKTLGSGIGLSYAKSLADGMSYPLIIETERYNSELDVFKVKITINN